MRGKTVLITGASKGIGLACAEAFAAEGCTLHLAARSADLLAEAKAQLEAAHDVAVHTYARDLSDDAAMRTLAEDVGDVDVLVGTQMIAKGHDFRRVTLVAAIDVDQALFSNDFRACERLFALLMQAGGRAGRDAHLTLARPSEMWLQTHHPKHALFEALKTHDYVRFATDQLRERALANMPPFSSQALIRVEARTAHAALGYLNELHTQGSSLLQEASELEPGSSFEDIFLYSAVPMQMQKLANVERYQLLIESSSRAHLQRFLRRLHEPLQALKKKHPGVLRWVIDVDPQSL